MDRYGLTEGEKAVWPPKKQIDAFSFSEKALYFAIACVAIAALIHFTCEPKATSIVNVAHADQLTDRQQEQKYCAAWATQRMPVQGGTAEAIREHCIRFL